MATTTYQDIINSDTPTLVDFYATWCGPCKMMQPILKNLYQDIKGKARILKVDIDKNQALAAKLKVKSVPTFILYKNGEVLWRQAGGQSQEQLKQQIESAL